MTGEWREDADACHANRALTTRTCEQHGDALVWEVGGPRMPTIFGRWVCPTCHRALMAALLEGWTTPPEVSDR